MADLVEEVKSRLGIVEVVSQYVQLKKAGKSYKGLCPFHSEKTPSFVVSPEKQICHCFGCSKGGDIFSFVEEVEGISFSEALRLLADRAGVKMDKFEKQNHAKKSEKDEYYKAHDLACAFFEKELTETNDGKKVLGYLKKRGLNDSSIKEFRIGFAPDDYKVLHSYLLKKGISKKVLIKSGFVSSKNIAADNIYDKFRGRLMFPIFDNIGRICGFGGRALKKDQMPKYLNSPENMIYSKSNVMYGFSHAKKFIKESGSVVLVEGYFDVILPYQSGVKNIVATSGTALTAAHAKLLKRFTSLAVSCFDADDAGFEATKRAYPLLQAQGIEMKTVSAMTGKDPADFVLDDLDGFKLVISDAKAFISVYIDSLLNRNDISGLDGRVKVLKELLPYFKDMMSVGKDHYIRELATKLSVTEKSLYDEIEHFQLPVGHPAKSFEPSEGDGSGIVAKMNIDDIVMALLLEYPFLFEKVVKSISENDFNDDIKSVYKVLTDQYNSSRDVFDSWDLDCKVLADLRGKVDVFLLFAEGKYGNFPKETLLMEIEKLTEKMKATRKAQKLKDIQSQIVEAERANEKEKLIKLLTIQQDLLSNSS